MRPVELREWAEAAGLEISEDGWERLRRLLGMWQQYGRAFNLVGATDESALAEHIQEGLQCVKCAESIEPVNNRCGWVDVGSGGGLPGLVVAAVRPCPVVLVEPRARRAAFLDLGLAAIGVGPGRVIRARWSATTWNKVVTSGLESRDKVDFVVLSSRAVFAPQQWLDEAKIASISRGLILCHVDSAVERVGKKKPRAISRGPRWNILGYPMGG